MKRLAVVLIALIVVAGVFLYYPRATGTSAAEAATLGVLSGDVDAQRAGADFAPALDGDVLAGGDTVRANATGRATVTFFDGSSLTVEPGSVVKIASVSKTASGGLSTVIEQSLGRTWASVERLKGDAHFEVRTPASTAIVRGTAFVIEVAADGTTTISTTEGEVLVQAQGQQQSVAAGNRSTTTTGQAPGAPVAQPATPKLRLLSQLSGLGYVVIDPQGRTCGANGGQQVRQIPGCNVVQGGASAGSVQVDVGEVVAGTYTLLLTASAALPGVSVALSGGSNLDQPDFRGQFGDAAGIRPGDFIRTTFTVAVNGTRLSAGAFVPAERVASVCGAEARGRVFSAGTLDERAGALAAYAQANRGQPAAIVIPERELGAAASAGVVNPAGAPASVGGVGVSIDGAGIHLRAQVTAGPISVPASADVVAGASNGALVLRVRSLDAGPLPAAIREQLAAGIDRSLAAFGGAFPLTVQRVALRTGCMAIIGVTR